MAFKFIYTTGPFSLPASTHSLDWAILNNDTTIQKVRVTIFKCNLGGVKTAEPPGALSLSIKPKETTHNANSYPTGVYYEITVECNSQLIFPYVSGWPGSVGDALPGSVINSSGFIRNLS